jgi:hypothetical protein
MARGIATNYAAPYAYTFGTAPTDLFKKEDVEVLAQALDWHDHAAGKGLPINGSVIVAGSITPDKLAAGAVANQPVGGDLAGTVSSASIQLRNNSNINAVNGGGVAHAFLNGGSGYHISYGMENGWLFRNYDTTADAVVINNLGDLSVNRDLSVARNVSINGSGTGIHFNHGAYIVDYDGGAAGAYVNINQLTVTPGAFACGVANVNGTLNSNVGSVLNGTTQMTGNGSIAGAFTMGGNAAVQGGLTIGGTLGVVGNMRTSGDIVIDAPRVVNLGPAPGGAIVSPGTNIGKSADTVYLSAHAYVFFDLGVGHIVTCQSLVQTSDPNLKSGATVMTDTACMGRIRDPGVPIYTYQLTPPSPTPPGPPQPTLTPNEIGLMAPDVFAHSPEFAALDGGGTPVGVNYPNITAMLWGALRDLDKRCTTFGIPA